MKKQVISIMLMSMIISLTGCGKDSSTPSVQLSSTTIKSEQITSVPTAEQTKETVSDKSADIQDIVGVWNETDVLDSRTLTIKADGTFELVYKGGGTQYGIVKAETAKNPDGSTYIWYNFYETDGKLWEGFQKSDDTPNDLYSGQDGAIHFVRAGTANNAA